MGIVDMVKWRLGVAYGRELGLHSLSESIERLKEEAERAQYRIKYLEAANKDMAGHLERRGKEATVVMTALRGDIDRLKGQLAIATSYEQTRESERDQALGVVENLQKHLNVVLGERDEAKKAFSELLETNAAIGAESDRLHDENKAMGARVHHFTAEMERIAGVMLSDDNPMGWVEVSEVLREMAQELRG